MRLANLIMASEKSSVLGSTARKCSAPFCRIDGSGKIFKLFPFPSNVVLKNKWKKNMCAGMKTPWNSGVEDNIVLCEVHFEDQCWDNQDLSVTLKPSAVPSVFQHNMLLEYINVVYQKLKALNINCQVADKGMLALEKLKAEGKLGYAEVQNELLSFSMLMVMSALQTVRICEKSSLLAASENKNAKLSKEVRELQGETQ